MFNLKKTPKNRSSQTKRKLSQILDGDGFTPERKHKPDYSILIVATILLLIGLVVMYSISPALSTAQGVSQHYFVTKQFIAVGLGVLAFVFFSTVSLDFLKRNRRTFIWLSLITTLAVQFVGEQRWVVIGGFSFQASELVKLTVVIWAACFLVEKVANSEIKSTKKTLYPLMVLIGLVGFFIVGLQSDFGSGGVIVAIAAVMAFAAGIPVKRLMLVAAIIAIGTVAAVASTPYRQDRISTFLNPTSDCQNAGYQSCQALIAIGSGGMFGLGVGNGVQAYGYLPEAENDSIFAIIGEKFGFIGTTAIIGLYALLFARMRRIILHTNDVFSKLVVIGVLTWLGGQTVINIGAMIGLLPLKGITLPFISYGGSSLLFVMAALGIVFKISRYTAFSPVRSAAVNQKEGGQRDDSISRRRQRRPHYAATRSR